MPTTDEETINVTAHLITGKSVRYRVPRDEMQGVFASLHKPDGVLVFKDVADDSNARHYVPVRTIAYIEESYA